MCFFSDCVPDPNAFEPDSDMGILLRKMRKLFEDVSEKSAPQSPVSLESKQTSATLQALGVKVGDKVVVGGVKVS